MEFNPNQPIYLQIANDLLRRLVTGAFQAGDRIPAVRDLAKEYKVNPNTMSSAMAELEKTGLFYTQRGLGTFVSEDGQKIRDFHERFLKERLEEVLNRFSEFGVGPEELLRRIRESIQSGHLEE